MTTAQKQAIKVLINNIKYYDLHTSEYCFKELSVHTDMIWGKPTVILYCETGNKNLFGGKIRQIMIGVNGGLTCFDNNKKNGKAALHSFQDIMLYGYRNY
nr:MAG TPA: hypothetical protein [Caudoviricetes sp.]